MRNPLTIRRALPALLVLTIPAFAADDKPAAADKSGPAAAALSGNERMDSDFAAALADGGYPDLAKKLLTVIGSKGGSSAETQAQIEEINLNIAWTEARK